MSPEQDRPRRHVAATDQDIADLRQDIADLRDTFLVAGIDIRDTDHRQEFGEHYRFLERRRQRRIRREGIQGLLWAGVAAAIIAALVTSWATTAYNWIVSWSARGPL